MVKKEKTGKKPSGGRKKLPEVYNKLLKVGAYDATHRKQLQQRAKKVQQLYKQAVDKIARAAAPSLFDADPAKEFHFSDFPALNKSVDEFIDDMGKQLQANIEDGDSDAWTLANAKNDMVVNTLASVYSLPKETLKEWRHPHLDALQEFEERRKSGMNLSNGGSEADIRKGVWNLDQFKNELELALEQGIGQGKSAVDLSRDVRQYLKYPNKLFRRVRDKDGVLRLSKAAAAFHPGRGVYRSSYKNALRLTATENNIAYRTCDHKRWNALPFVLGQEIKTSNNHPEPDICDTLAGKYPIEFKFTGWHPFCRCYAVSILASEKELDDYCSKLEQGTNVSEYQFTGKQTQMPEAFTTWMKDNEGRIAKAKSLPYFIKDNYKDGDPAKGLRWTDKKETAKQRIFRMAAERHAARTQAQRDDILRRWSESRNHAHIIDRAKKTIAIAERYPSYNIASLYKAVYNLDYAEVEKLTAMQRKVLVNFAQVERRAIEAKIKIRAIETDPSRIKLGEDLADSVIRRLRANKKTALADARKWLTKLENSIPKENLSFAERLNAGETAGELATRLGKDCPATLKHLQAKVEELEKGIEKEFTAKEREDFREGMKKVLEANDFCTNVDSQYLPSIIKEHLKNQFETGSSDGLMDTTVRRHFSENAFGTATKGVKGEEYEKYGSIIPKDLSSKGTSYGDTVIRWKKNKVPCTFTIGDSLDFGMWVSPSLTTDPSIISVGKSGKSWMNKDLAKFRKTMEKTGGDLEQAKKLLGSPGYIEIQLHGKVDVDCIESVVLPSTDRVFRTAAQEKKFKEAINILLDKEIPVYQRESGTSKKLIKITKEYLEKNDI